MESELENPKPPWWRVILVGRRPKRTLLRLTVLVVLAFFVFRFVLLPIRVVGISMLPTYREGGVNLVNCLAYRFGRPQRGDVVAIKLAGKHVMFMKRVVGLPGETIGFHRGKLVVNGEVIEEPYLKLPSNWTVKPEVIGEGEYYVVGDNRSMDHRDHEKGRATLDRIVGKVLL
jgi:signal peptidase I